MTNKIDKEMAIGLFQAYAEQAKIAYDDQVDGEMRSVVFDCSDIVGDCIAVEFDDLYSDKLAEKTARRLLARELITTYA
jgi:hypothetical protein